MDSQLSCKSSCFQQQKEAEFKSNPWQFLRYLKIRKNRSGMELTTSKICNNYLFQIGIDRHLP